MSLHPPLAVPRPAPLHPHRPERAVCGPHVLLLLVYALALAAAVVLGSAAQVAAAGVLGVVLVGREVACRTARRTARARA